MVSLYNYFIKSIFIRGMENPINSRIAPQPDLSSLSEEELKKIKYGIWEYNTSIVDESDTRYELLGLVRAFEKNNGRNIEDIVRFHANIDVLEDEVMVETEINLDREVDGENHDLASVRDGLLPIGYQTGSHTINITEYYTLLSNGKRLLHHSPFTKSFEVYEIDPSVKFGEGIKYSGLKVFNGEDPEIDDPDIDEIRRIINNNNSVMRLIRK